VPIVINMVCKSFENVNLHTYMPKFLHLHGGNLNVCKVSVCQIYLHGARVNVLRECFEAY
jgi:hypothetical protein